MVEKVLPEIKMFGYWRSSASWRLRLVFAHKGIKYEYVPVNLLKNEQATDEFVKMNPSKVRKKQMANLVSLFQQSFWKKEVKSLFCQRVSQSVNTSRRCTHTCQNFYLMTSLRNGKLEDFANKLTQVLNRSKTWASQLRSELGLGTIKKCHGSNGLLYEDLMHSRNYWLTPRANTASVTKLLWPTSSWSRKSTLPSASRSTSLSGLKSQKSLRTLSNSKFMRQHTRTIRSMRLSDVRVSSLIYWDKF